MANTNAPFGYRPVRHYTGGVIRMGEYAIASGLGSNIFRGDPVKLTNTTNQIDVAAAGDRLLGVFWGCEYTATDGEQIFRAYWPTGTTVKSGTTVKAYVYDDPDIVFEAQMDGAFTDADIGTVADIDMGTAGSTLTGTSGAAVDTGTVSGSGSAQVLIIGRSRRVPNESATYAVVDVLINEHYRKAAMTAI